ncbi:MULTISPECIES: YybH family protein [Hyphobacterium]|uniref:YybH family protein n=1 Tax=Hyphobacterium vulgare TaxID=1736751 RepID=A0ABV7A043_9PROT
MTDQPSDEEQIHELILEAYRMVSGPAGPRDWSRQDAVFHEDSRQIRTGVNPDGSMWMRVMGREAYRADTEPFFAANDFYEVELASEIRVFGNIAHAWSQYEARTSLGDVVPERRGINSIQFLKGPDGRWQIIHMIWDNERIGLNLPGSVQRF